MEAAAPCRVTVFLARRRQAGAADPVQRIDPVGFQNRYRMRRFDMWGDHAGQPTVRWRAEVVDRRDSTPRTVEGHVEIRWSHGKFAGVPEAKIYLDTPHHDVAGYELIDSGN
ncbi:MAG: hypothetical protein OXF75_07655 [Acidimicrobiaceae bacterium]|nr:hypothetical protein [Acidimicrobiaceae bacterium]